MLPQACGGVGLLPTTALTGDPRDPRVAWIVQNGVRINVLFPPGLVARFTPKLEVIDARSQAVVARDGDPIEDACVVSANEGDPVLILWEQASTPPTTTPTSASSSSAPTGLSDIAPGPAYTTTAFAPSVEYHNNVLDTDAHSRVLDEAAAVMVTATGEPYKEVTATFDCTGTGLCQLKIVGVLDGAVDPDIWWFNLGHDAERFDLETSQTYAKTIWWSVPQGAIDGLAAIVEAAPVAAARAKSYLSFAHAGWFPNRPTTMTLTYSRPSGFIGGPPIANATTDYLTITIDITAGQVVDIDEMNLDG